MQRDVEFLTNLTKDFRKQGARKQGAEVYPIFLTCDEATLYKRTTEESRKAYGKITTEEVMKQMIEMHDFKTPLDVEGNVSFNTGEKSAKEVAAEIKGLANL